MPEGDETSMLTCVSPIDGLVVAERPARSYDFAKIVVAKARATQRSWARRPIEERIALVRDGIVRLGRDDDQMVVELATMMGRPVCYGGEYRGVVERSEAMFDMAAMALEPSVVEQSPSVLRRIDRTPCGVVLVVAPWNYPYMTAINTIVPALVAGNAVVLKHASQTLLAGERLERAFAGLPDGLFCNLQVDHATTAKLLRARCFDYVNFTGSVAGGRAIERSLAGTFVGSGLELGGKDPAYVLEDADLETTVPALMDAVTFNSGQSCCGVERVYVAEGRFDELVERSAVWLSELRLGNPLDQKVTLGPMASQSHADGVRRLVGAALAAGAKAIVDPGLFSEYAGAYLGPQALTDVDHSMPFMREETFGPVVGIMPVHDDDEAVAMMNDSRYGLSASLWTSDFDRAASIGERIETGTVFLNRADYVDPGLCWTGCKMTGRGATLSTLGFHSVTRPKSYHLRAPLS